MEVWGLWRLGWEGNLVHRKNKRTELTSTGLLMEGLYAQPLPRQF
jgi:hypothetical protein